MTSFDALILGAGPAGEVCAAELAAGGLRVAIAEHELVGGECSSWGCIPSKTLLRPGEALAAARAVPGAREAVRGPVEALPALAWRDLMVSGHDDVSAARWLADAGVELLRGTARLRGRGEVEIGGVVHTARDVVVATGSEATLPPVPGLAGLPGVWTNREATAAREVPRRLLVLGAGAVGVELAQAFARLGAEVTLIEAADRVLAREPAAVGEAVADALAADGVALRTGRRAAAARRAGGRLVLDLDDGERLRGDHLLVATGRRPRVPDGLAAAGAQAGPHGIAVDARMAAGEGLWAVGDVTGIWPLTYVGKYQARIAAANILGADARASYGAVPRVVFCDPQAAAVGDADGPYVATAPLTGVARAATYARHPERRPGFLTLVSDGERLTGAAAVGPEAGEWLQQATLAIRARIPLRVLRDTIQPFPTFSEAFVTGLAGLTAQLAVGSQPTVRRAPVTPG